MPPALPIATPSPLKAPSYIQPSPPLSSGTSPHAICFQGRRKGGVWGFLSCLGCLLGDLGFGTRTASLLEEKKR